MDTIQIKDKLFTVSIKEQEIQKEVIRVANEINRDLAGKNPLFLSVLNGSFMFTADLLKHITIPCEISFVKLASYQGITSTGVIKEVIGLNEDIAGRTIVIVEDIVDTGLTMQRLLETLGTRNPEAIHIASLLVKPEKLKVNLNIEYVAMEIPNDFIVGYGLDYDGFGRNYHIEYIRLSENNILDYASNGLVLLLDGVKNTRNGHSTSTSIWEDLSGNNNDLTLENVVSNSNNMYLDGINSKVYSEKALDVVSVEMVLELEEKNDYVYIASFGKNSKSMAWSPVSDKGFSLGTHKKKYLVENLYKKNSISVQYNPDLLYLNSEKLNNNLPIESWAGPSSYPIAFGFYGNNGYRMKGKIYSIRIYNRALTEDII